MSKKFYGKILNYRIWYYLYSNKRIINIYKYFSKEDLNILSKLKITLENKLYTKKEFELMDMKLYEYYEADENDNIIENALLLEKSISKNEYEKILNIFNNIAKDYNL